MCLAIPGKVLEITGTEPLLKMGLVNFGGTINEVSLALVPEAKPGDYVYVHVGVALSIIDEAEAIEVLGYFHALEVSAPPESESA